MYKERDIIYQIPFDQGYHLFLLLKSKILHTTGKRFDDGILPI